MFKYIATLTDPTRETYEVPGYKFVYNEPQEVPSVIANIVKNSIFFKVTEEMTLGLDDMKLVKDEADTAEEVEEVVKEEQAVAAEKPKRHRKAKVAPEAPAEPTPEQEA